MTANLDYAIQAKWGGLYLVWRKHGKVQIDLMTGRRL